MTINHEDNREYNVGDVIRIVGDLNANDTYDGWCVPSEMVRMAQDNPIRRIVEKDIDYRCAYIYRLEGQKIII